MARLTTAPISLSTGHTIPKGTRICFPAHAIHNSPLTTTFSPSYNPPSAKPPSEFDGFRFYKLRTMEGKENRHQFVTTSVDSLTFGHGSHACPGRFFASNEMKVVLVELLRHWEFRLKGDVEGVGGVDKRPRRLYGELSILPDPRAEIEVRRRKVEKDNLPVTVCQVHN
jgi:gliotoxin biosynthesis cytochrome P450 monooxygenase